MYSYKAWEVDTHGGFCTLTPLENVEDDFELQYGVSRLDNFTKEACFRMDPAFPKDIKLADNIQNIGGLIVVSKTLKQFVESYKPLFTEFLPVTIYNHKDRIESSDYFILNPYQVIDCIEVDDSDIEWNEIDPELISACFDLVLDEDRLDEKLLLFRPRYMPTVVLVREDLAEKLRKADFTGLRFTELEEFEL